MSFERGIQLVSMVWKLPLLSLLSKYDTYFCSVSVQVQCRHSRFINAFPIVRRFNGAGCKVYLGACASLDHFQLMLCFNQIFLRDLKSETRDYFAVKRYN